MKLEFNVVGLKQLNHGGEVSRYSKTFILTDNIEVLVKNEDSVLFKKFYKNKK